MGDFFNEWYAPLTGGAIFVTSLLGTYLLRMRQGRDPIQSANIIVFTLLYFVVLTASTLLPINAVGYLALGTSLFVAILIGYDAVLSLVRRHTKN